MGGTAGSYETVTYPNGSTYDFSDFDPQLKVYHRDRHGNTITYEFESNGGNATRPFRITDTLGRQVTLSYSTARGQWYLLESVTVKNHAGTDLVHSFEFEQKSINVTEWEWTPGGYRRHYGCELSEVGSSLVDGIEIGSGRRGFAGLSWSPDMKRARVGVRLPFVTSSAGGLYIGLDLREEHWDHTSSGRQFFQRTQVFFADYEYIFAGRKSSTIGTSYEHQFLEFSGADRTKFQITMLDRLGEPHQERREPLQSCHFRAEKAWDRCSRRVNSNPLRWGIGCLRRR